MIAIISARWRLLDNTPLESLPSNKLRGSNSVPYLPQLAYDLLGLICSIRLSMLIVEELCKCTTVEVAPYHDTDVPHIDLVTPLHIQNHLWCSVHIRHDIVLVFNISKNGLTQIAEYRHPRSQR